jgi:superfamily I DNA and/or RNA helicase
MKLIVEQSNVVGATCLFSGGQRMPEANFDWAIIDEAGRATVPEALVPMVKAERVILVGDERQLPPMVDDMMDAESPYASEDVPLEKSLFHFGRGDGSPAPDQSPYSVPDAPSDWEPDQCSIL